MKPLSFFFAFLLLITPAQADEINPDLVQLFQDWRTFEQPAIVDGAPDYSAEAMAAKHVELIALGPSGSL